MGFFHFHQHAVFDMQSLNTIVQKDPSIVSRRIADEVILVPIRRKVEEVECLYTLNEVGARIWELLDGRRPLKVVRDALVAEFEVSEKEAEEDLLTLFDQLKQIGAIQEPRQPIGESLPPAAFAVSEPGRAEPELETAVQVGVDPIAMVVTMEDHDGAYYAWKRAGVTGRILLHIDAHIDWNWIADKDPHNLLDARGLEQVESMLEDRCLWNLSERRSEELVHIGNYIYPALQEGIVKEFYWVVPDSFVASPAKLRHLVRQFRSLKRFNPRAMKTVRVEKNRVVAEINGAKVTACSLTELPVIREPVLLDIDTDFLMPESHEVARSGQDLRRQLPWIWPDELVHRLRDKRVRTDFVTIAYSVEGGFTPLHYKYLGDELALRLKHPSLPERDRELFAQKRLAAQYRHHSELEKAFAAFEEAVKILPEDASSHFNLADLYDETGAYEKAAVRYRQAVQLDPTYATGYNNFGPIYQSLSMLERARGEYQRVLRWDSQNADAQYGLAEALAQEEKWDNAISQYRTAIALNPAHAGAHRDLGFALMKCERWEEAITQCRHCIALKPHDGFAYFLLGEALLQQRRWDEALEAFRAALRCGFRTVRTHRRLGDLYLRKRKFHKALKQYRKALRLRTAVATSNTTERLRTFMKKLSRE